VILQDFARYQTCAKGNIWFGDVRKDMDSPGLFSAARSSGAMDFAQRFPADLDTLLGKRFPRGVEPSGGEWQKIAIARTFFRNAGLIVLDEPTSSLDARAEYSLFESFREFLNGKSALIISHQFPTVRMADYIYVVDSGRIVEEGTHSQLLSIKGRYASFYDFQAKGYVKE
jgi:ATP-binding cassette subfamily B protein